MEQEITLFGMSTSWVELVGAVIGIIYVVLEYKANRWLWLFGMLMPLFYIYLFFREGAYANGLLNVYYVIVCVYGFLAWRKSTAAAQKPQEGTTSDVSCEETDGVKSLPCRYWIYILLAVGALTMLLAWVLGFFGEQVAWLDALTTALSCVAMWMLAKKYYQQWILLIVANPITIALSLRLELYPAAAMYLFFAIISIMGFVRWKRLYELSGTK